MDSTSPRFEPRRVRDRVVRMVHAKVAGVDPVLCVWSTTAPTTGKFQPTSLRVTYSRDGLDSDGEWDIIAVAGGPVIRKDGSLGSRAATRTWAHDAGDEHEPDWPAWVIQFVTATHPANLPSVPQ